MGLKVLVVGSGGREHALAAALAADAEVDEVVATPGNPGIAAVARLVTGDPLEVARQEKPDLVVIGPEAPLVDGLADRLRAEGIATFGPSAAAAQLEGSKAFAKDVMTAADVPTARHWTCETPGELAAALDAAGPPYVVKHDELAAGKGVLVTSDRAAAEAHARGHRVVIEEHVDGPEVSLFCVTDGRTVVPLLPAQDFKRVGDGDSGPNTGGMGAYAPLPWLPDGVVDEVVKTIAQPTVDAMADRGTPFAGLLYVGLFLSSRGIKVCEFNARFGDPETQVVLPLLESSLGELLLAAATGSLAEHPPLQWRDESAVVVVVASDGYPASPRTGDAIDGLDDVASVDGVDVVHAGTSYDDHRRLVTSGGRVLGVRGIGPDLATARQRAYDGVAAVRINGAHWRTDIAANPRGAES